mmetsp:Transcript_8403/g.17376  ORF Transcript_8403/g.17376 Transcript_8403/m.17376 type:complete len:252 (-) Transcript_8403:679-1434(-)|eukprot:CAMPEP_0118923000 /NCGR_PEP_ID=MMETSP1169-20130426/1695_1 /TAXON_ID=36882 /ORGANISM="Pyramimonas obovata, Strain CCMP722" /LENGTH=251 /DNA_ID=CAMNT_0006863931 /DNA_START=308 /DNA_END=1063 /DNA_ORIENTATION=+
MALVANMQNVALGQAQRCELKTTSRGVIGVPALRLPNRRAKSFKVSAQLDGRAQRAHEASTSGLNAVQNSALQEQASAPEPLLHPSTTAAFDCVSFTPTLASVVRNMSQRTSVGGGFKQEIVSALQMTSPANIMYTTQTRFTTLDRPALGTGQALGFVLAAAGVYIAMLISAFAFGKSEDKVAWRKRRFQNRVQGPRVSLRHAYHTRRAAPRDGLKRPYVQHALQVSNLLLQSDPPPQLQRYPARVQCTAR